MRRPLVATILLALLVLSAAACGEDAGDAGQGADDGGEEEQCLVTEDVEVGEGAEATTGSIVRVHYTGTLEDGTEFDSSRGREPFSFTLGGGQVIQGWEEGIVGMREGGTRNLTICPDMAYGEQGYPGAIPPNATLMFEVELLRVREA